MRPRALAVFALPLLLATLVLPKDGDEAGTVLRVVDGDTLQVRIDGRKEKVRLIGVDTPESVDPRRPVQPFGKEAAEFTRRLAGGKAVTLRGEDGTPGRDRYNRLLRYVYLPDGTLLNAEIIRQGYGHAYVRQPFSRLEEFRTYERQAREKGLGLWARGAPGGRPTAARRTVSQPPPAGKAAFVGSIRGRVYHRPGCERAGKIVPANRITFIGTREARSAGYAPCKACRPPAG